MFREPTFNSLNFVTLMMKLKVFLVSLKACTYVYVVPIMYIHLTFYYLLFLKRILISSFLIRNVHIHISILKLVVNDGSALAIVFQQISKITQNAVLNIVKKKVVAVEFCKHLTEVSRSSGKIKDIYIFKELAK